MSVQRCTSTRLLVLGFVVMGVGCASSSRGFEQNYPDEVLAAGSVGHWRLSGDINGAISGDSDGARAFKSGQREVLEGVDFGGAEVALEVWVKDAKGTLLTYLDKEKSPIVTVTAADALELDWFGKRLPTDIVLERGRWQHLGVSWRGEDGLLMVVVDGKLAWWGHTAPGSRMPFGGGLVLGGDLEGQLDEVAVFDSFKFAGHWLDRVNVARGSSPPSVPDARQQTRVVLQRGHTGRIHDVSWSPDGTVIASSSSDTSVKIWDAASGALLHDMVDHFKPVNDIDWSPDGRLVASASNDKTVKIWDASSGELLQDLTEHGDMVRKVAWSPDGRLVASSCMGMDETIRVWSAREGTLVHQLEGHPHRVNDIAWSPDGRLLASSGDDRMVKLWDAGTGGLVHNLEGHRGWVKTLAWHPDGSKLASASHDRTAKVWDPDSGRLLYDLEGHTRRVEAVAWSPDGLALASGSGRVGDGVVFLWGAKNGERLAELSAGDGSSILWSPMGQVLATKGYDKVRVLEVNSGNLLQGLGDHTQPAHALSWSPGGRSLAAAYDNGTIKIWNTGEGSLRWHLRPRVDEVVEIVSSPDRSLLAGIALQGAAVQIWDAVNGVLLQRFSREDHKVTHVSWSPDSRKLVLSFTNKALDKVMELRDAVGGQLLSTMKMPFYKVDWSLDGKTLSSGHSLWDAITGRQLFQISEKGYGTTGGVWSPTGDRLAVLKERKRVDLWDASTGRKAAELDAFQEGNARDKDRQTPTIIWSPDGQRFATSGGSESLVKVWEGATGELLSTFEAHSRPTNLVSWSPDSRALASAIVNRRSEPYKKNLSIVHFDAEFRVWDPGTGAVIKTLDVRDFEIKSILWGPKGERLAATSPKGVKVWDVTSGEVIRTLDEHPDDIELLSWSPESDKLAVGGGEVAAVWSVSTGERLMVHEDHKGEPQTMSWGPGGELLASSSGDGTVEFWNVAQGKALTLLGGEGGAWLAIDERGHFDGSANAGGLLLIAQGASAFAIDQLAPTRNRPDLLLEILGASPQEIAFYRALWLRRLKRLGLDPKAVSEDFTSAPTVRIVSFEEADSQGVVKLDVLFEGGADLRSYRVNVNGVPTARQGTTLQGKKQRLSIRIQLSRGTNLIEITALNVLGVESLRASTSLDHEGQGLPRPRLFYLGFGLSDYEDDRIELGFAHQDALDLKETLSGATGGFASVEVKAFTDTEVTEAALEQARAFINQVSEHDTFVMFIAGHGARDNSPERTYYYLDHDARFEDLAGTAIPFEKIEALLYEARARKKLFLMDTCQSGEDINIAALTEDLGNIRGLKARSIRGGQWAGKMTLGEPSSALEVKPQPGARTASLRWLSALRNRDRMIVQDLARRSGAIVLASSLGQESSLEAPRWKNGAFTEELLKALQTPVADTNKDGVVDTDELKAYVTSAVPLLTGGRQHPNVERDNPLQKFALPIARP